MGKVLFTSVVADIRGKLNGHVYAKNRGGNYVRTKTTPTNPQTIAQQEIRNSFSIVSQSWRTLTVSERAAWVTLAMANPYTDVFGFTRYYSGFQIFMSRNISLVAAGVALIREPVEPQVMPVIAAGGLRPSFEIYVGETTIGNINVDIDFESPIANFEVLTDAAPLMTSPGYNVNTLYKQVDRTLVDGSSAELFLYNGYIAIFGNQLASLDPYNNYLYLRIKFLDRLSGALSQPVLIVVQSQPG